MKASRDLDYLISKHVFDEPWNGCNKTALYKSKEHMPFFSTDMAAAALVIKKMRGQGKLLTLYDNFRIDYRASFSPDSPPEYVAGETVPHSICLAALAACKVEM